MFVLDSICKRDNIDCKKSPKLGKDTDFCEIAGIRSFLRNYPPILSALRFFGGKSGRNLRLSWFTHRMGFPFVSSINPSGFRHFPPDTMATCTDDVASDERLPWPVAGHPDGRFVTQNLFLSGRSAQICTFVLHAGRWKNG